MSYKFPKSMGDDQAERTDFLNTTLVVDNGWTMASGSSVAGGSLNVSAAKPFVPNFFWEKGGTLRLKLKFNDTDATLRRWFFLGKDANYLMQFYYIGSTGNAIFELRNGSGNNYYKVTQPGTLVPGTMKDIVITWNPSTTTLTSYVDGGNAITNSTASSVYAGSYDTTYNTIKIGNVASGISMTDMDTYSIEIYRSIWSAEEVADAYANSTYSEIDASKAQVYLPLRSRFNNGTNEVTKNLGKGGDVIVGDGSTSTTYPTQINPHGMTFDGTTDYLKLSDADVTAMSTWTEGTIFMGFRYTGNALDSGFTRTLFAFTDNSASDDYVELSFYDPSGGGDTVDFLTYAAYTNASLRLVARASNTMTLGLHTVAAVVDATSNQGNRMYIDGVLQTLTYDVGTSASYSACFFSGCTDADWASIGASKRSAVVQRFYTGNLYEPMLTNEPLTQRQIADLHQKFIRNINN